MPSRDLFEGQDAPEHLPVQGADILFLAHMELGVPESSLLEGLIADTPWRQEEIVVWGKRHLQPRLIAWYGDPTREYRYSGIRLRPLPWTNVLLKVKARVERIVEVSFNSVLLNYYRDNNDGMGFHSDDEPELGPRPVIASVSLGAERVFVLKPKRHGRSERIRLPSGSLLVMRGDTQKNWKHGIEKQTLKIGPRVNLTFRQIVANQAR